MTDLLDLLESIWKDLVDLFPRLVFSLMIILIGLIIGKIIQRQLRKLILYLDERVNLQLQQSRLNVDLKHSATFIPRVFFWVIMLIALTFCIQVLQLAFLRAWINSIVGYLPNIIAAVVIIFAGLIAGRLLSDIVKSAAAKTGFSNGKLLSRLTRFLIQFIAVVIALGQLGIQVEFLTNLFIILLASLLFGAALAFGLGAKTSVSNILGSYYIRRTYPLGSRIKIGERQGIIVKISDDSVLLETSEGVVVIPSKEFSETQVTIIKDDNEK